VYSNQQAAYWELREKNKSRIFNLVNVRQACGDFEGEILFDFEAPEDDEGRLDVTTAFFLQGIYSSNILERSDAMAEHHQHLL
jgi:hypothetical protein